MRGNSHARSQEYTSASVARTYTFMSHTRRVRQFIRPREGERTAGDGFKLGGDRLCHQPLRANFLSASFPLALWLSKRLLDMWISFLDPLQPSSPFWPQLGLLLKALQWSAAQTDDKILFIKTLTVCSQRIIKPIYLHSHQSIKLI